MYSKTLNSCPDSDSECNVCSFLMGKSFYFWVIRICVTRLITLYMYSALVRDPRNMGYPNPQAASTRKAGWSSLNPQSGPQNVVTTFDPDHLIDQHYVNDQPIRIDKKMLSDRKNRCVLQ